MINIEHRYIDSHRAQIHIAEAVLLMSTIKRMTSFGDGCITKVKVLKYPKAFQFYSALLKSLNINKM